MVFKKGLVPWNKGKKMPLEVGLKVSQKRKGQHNSPRTEFKKGMIPWSKGKHVWSRDRPHPMLGIRRSEETKKKISEKVRLWNTTHKRVAWNKGKHVSEETKEKIRLKMKQLWQDPIFRDRIIKQTLIGLKKRPTSLESKFIQLIEKHRLPFRFCGDGSFLIGFKNPDFIHIGGEKVCIEVANRIPWHHPEGWAQERIEHFEKHGWKCLVIWWDEIFSDKWGNNTVPNWEEKILEKLKNFYFFFTIGKPDFEFSMTCNVLGKSIESFSSFEKKNNGPLE